MPQSDSPNSGEPEYVVVSQFENYLAPQSESGIIIGIKFQF